MPSVAMPAQDDLELFDLIDEEGHPLGRTKARREVHKDGDWHRSLHIWVVLESASERPSLVFQKRCASKDTWPRALDVSVSGHFRAGESLREALREAEEEIGLRLEEKDLVRLGVRKRSDRGRAGLIDNELQDIFAARVSCSLGDLAPNADEVEWLLALSVEQAEALFRGASSSLVGRAISGKGRESFGVSVERGDFVPDGDGYYARASGAVLRWLGGRGVEPFCIG